MTDHLLKNLLFNSKSTKTSSKPVYVKYMLSSLSVKYVSPKILENFFKFFYDLPPPLD